MKNFFETRYAGLKLSNPIIVGSSGLTNSVEKNKELERVGVGALVLKSLFEEQITMQFEWMTANSDYPDAQDFIRSYVKNNQLKDYLHLIRDTKNTCQIPVIASINCYKAEAWFEFAHQIELAGADAIQLNFSALNTNLEKEEELLEGAFIRILQEMKKTVNIPIIIKMGKNFSNIVRTASRFHENGASGLVLFNRFYQPDIDIYKLQVISGQVFSSHSDIADTLRWTAIVSRRIPPLSLASSTGIHDWEDIVKCLLAGASVVEVCSTIYQHGSKIIPQMRRSIEEWMSFMNFQSIDDFRGKLSYSNIPDFTLYERIQFLKYFSNRD